MVNTNLIDTFSNKIVEFLDFHSNSTFQRYIKIFIIIEKTSLYQFM